MYWCLCGGAAIRFWNYVFPRPTGFQRNFTALSMSFESPWYSFVFRREAIHWGWSVQRFGNCETRLFGYSMNDLFFGTMVPWGRSRPRKIPHDVRCKDVLFFLCVWGTNALFLGTVRYHPPFCGLEADVDVLPLRWVMLSMPFVTIW